MKKTLHFLLLIVLSTNVIAQKANLVWAKQSGGTDDEYSSSIVVDANGNVFTTGGFYSTADFDPGAGISTITSAGLQDIFIQKLDPDGNLLWVKQIGGSSQDNSTSLNTDMKGNLYLTGNFGVTVDFNPGAGINNLISFGQNDAFILKLDTDGNFIWVKQMGGSAYESSQSISADENGNLYCTGYFFGTVDFDPGPGESTFTASGSQDIYIQKLDLNGDLIWVKQMGGTNDDMGYSIDLDENNNAYITGHFSGSVDFDPGSDVYSLVSNSGSYDIFIQKFDTDGNFIWAKQIGESTLDIGQAISVTPVGDVFVTGIFHGTVDFDPGAGTTALSSTNGAVYIEKLDAAGNYIWAKQLSGTGWSNGLDITVDSYGDVYFIGQFNGTVDFDPGAGVMNLVSTGNNDIFFQRLDVDGNFIWAKKSGGTGEDAGISIDVDNNGNIYALGYFRNIVDFNPNAGVNNLISSGYYDISIQKLSQCTTVTDISTVASGSTIISNTSGATYQWLDCQNGYSNIAGETAQSFNITADGNYSVEICQNGCIDTSLCENVLVTSIFYFSSSEIKAFPNPAHDKITLDLGNSLVSDIIIYDAQGREVYSMNDCRQPFIELSFNPGLYVGEIRVENRKETIKFSVE